MKKFIILIPVFNDWKSLSKLLLEINRNIKDIQNAQFECVIINDASTNKNSNVSIPSHINSLEIINMKENKGHARCNAFGIRYLSLKNNFDYLILMDGDGEDRPEEIKLLVEKICNFPETSVVAKRIKRSEGPLFQALYQIHKFITFISTGKKINFGNYSCLTRRDLKILSNKESLWSSFSGSFKKNILSFNSINSIRGKRYFGPSKMSFFRLIIHSLSIIAVFKFNVFIRSSILILLNYYFLNLIKINASFSLIFIVLFNLAIYLVSLRENRDEFLKSQENIGNKEIFTH